MHRIVRATVTASLLAAATAFAQTPPPAYGAPISLAQAKKAMAAAEAEASKNSWPVAIAIVDTWDPLESTCRHASLSIL